MTSIMQRHPESKQALLYLDIDKLHIVNDAFGHMAGDQVIRAVSRIIDELAGRDDAVSHLSGDSFGLYVRDCDERAAIEKAELILHTLSQETIEYDGKSVDVGASIGIALIPDVVNDASAALNTAEIASRSAADRGGNRCVVFRDLDASVAQRRSDLDQVSHLQSALIQNRLVLFAQRIFAIDDSEDIHRFEILVRMLDETGAILSPDKFMSSAERYQMMSSIDRWVIRNALDMIGSADNLLEVTLSSFSINVSAQSLADDDFIDFIEQQIGESAISPDTLCFEITETSIVKNLERARRFIRRLRKLGCRIALDDFGTGYCSFAYLKDLPVQYIKIDGVFVRDILENPLSQAIVSSLANIARVMKAGIVAEHVENELVIHRLREYDIDFVQGFAVGKPAPLAEQLASLGPAIVLDATTRELGDSA
jgi:Amt family ammonium transporter